MKRAFTTAVLMLCCIFFTCSPSMAHAPAIENGLGFLDANQNQDGSWGSDASLTGAFFTSAKVVESLAKIGEITRPSYDTGATWILDQSPEATAELALRINASAQAGQDLDLLVSYADIYVNAWGGHEFYGNNHLDTALASMALKQVHDGDPHISDIIERSVNYLKDHQNPDGGWGFTSDDESDLYVSAIVLSAVLKNRNVNLQTCIINAVQYLLSHHNTDGGFGAGGTSTIYESAYAFFTLQESGTDIITMALELQSYLTNAQQSNGSWNNDPYETALAIRALFLLQPNLSASANDITFSPPMPTTNQSVGATVTVFNTGYDVAHSVVVRFFNGDPAAGGVQLGTDQSIAILEPGQSASVAITDRFTGSGARNIFIAIDADNVIDELNERDNITSKWLWIATGSDLAILSGDIRPANFTPEPGSPFTLEYHVRNLGESDVGVFNVALYDGDPDEGGLLLQQTNLSGLPGASSRTGTLGVTLDTAGSHSLHLVADSNNQISETSENNNRSSVTVTVGGSTGGADLVIESGGIAITPGRPVAGETVQIDLQVHNYGMERVDNATLELFNGDPGSGGVLLDSVSIGLDPGQGYTMASAWSVPAGNHRLYAVLDRGNAVMEINENNNIATAGLMTDMVDIVLSATDLRFNPEYPVAGDATSLSITASNTGTSATDTFNLVLYDGDPAAGGSLLHSFFVDNLAGDAESTYVYMFTAEARTYRFYAVADQENLVQEFSEQNNTAIRTMTVKGPGETYGPDLLPLEISISEDSVTDPDSLSIVGSVRVKVQNRGDEKIEDVFTVLVFEDRDLDGKFTPNVDAHLGAIEHDQPMWPNGVFSVDVPISGELRFLGAPLSTMIDADDVLVEQDEENNTLVSGTDCEVRPTAPIQPVVEWRWHQPQMPYNICLINNPPAIINIDDDNGDGRVNTDDIPDLVFNMIPDNYSEYGQLHGELRAFSGLDGSEIFKIFNADTYFNWSGGVAAGDIDNDGYPEIITNTRLVPNVGTTLIAYEHDGSLKWENSAQILEYRAQNPGYWVGVSEDTKPILADLDGDGHIEIIAGSGVNIFNADGSVKAGPYSNHGITGANRATEIVVDLDMDGVQEIIAGNKAINSDATIKWQNRITPNGFTAVGNLDEDSYPEIVVVDGSRGPQYGLSLHVLEHDGSVKWGPIDLNILEGIQNLIHEGQYPIIADFDGDGTSEIGIRNVFTYFIFDRNGQVKTRLELKRLPNATFDREARNAPTVFDLNGDGRSEVLIKSGGHFQIFDGKDGSLLFEEPFGTPTHIHQYQGILVADVDGDNQAEVVVLGYDPNTREAIRVYGSANNDWINARRTWNQQSYHASNIEDDGGIPRHEEPSWLTHNTYRCQLPVGDYANPYLTANVTASYLRMATGHQDDVTITVRVGNGGAAVVAPNTAVDIYLGDAGTGTVLGAAATTRPLAPGQYQDISIIYNGTIDDGDPITVVVDPSDTVSECNEQDNLVQSYYSEPMGVPDLKIASEDIVLPVGDIAEGDIVTVTAIVHNIGSADAAATSVQLYNGHPASGGTALTGAQTLATIGAGTSEPVTFVIDTLGLGGITMCYMVVDGVDQIAEQSEDNNIAVFALETVAPSLPNLVVGEADIQISPADVQPGQSVTIAATIRNRGTTTAGIPVRFYLDDPDQGGRQIFGQTIFADLVHGASTTLQTSLSTTNLGGQIYIHVVVDPLNIIAESNEQDNRADSALFVQSAGLGAQVTTNKNSYSSGEDVEVNWSVTDSSGAVRQLTADILILDATGNVMATMADSQSVTVGDNSTVSQTHSWNTGRALNGNYTVVIELHEGLHKVARTSIGFGIAENKSLDLQVACDRIAYEANQPVVINAMAISRSVNAIIEDLRALVQILAPDQSQLHSSDQSFSTLMPEALVRFTRNWNSGVHPAGQYTIVLSIYQDQLQLASVRTSFAINASSAGGQGLAGSLTVAPTLVQRGAQIALASRIENRGNADINAATVRISIVEPQGQVVLDTIDTSADLTIGALVAHQHSYATMELDPGIYLAILQVSADGFAKPRTIDSVRFEVEPGEVIDADVVPVDPVNLLVWVNDRCRRSTTGDRDDDSDDDDHGRHGHRYHDDDDKGRRYGYGKGRCQQQTCVDTDLFEALLVETVDDYRIVVSPKAFAIELRNPYYTDILILGDHRSLHRHTRDELREKVFSGTGLISSKYHAPWMFKHEAGYRHHRTSILGVSTNGNLRHRNRQVEFVPSELGIEGMIDIDGSITVVKPTEAATVAAWFSANRPGKHRGRSCYRPKKYPALVLHGYGKGKTVFSSFDLGLNLTSSSEVKIKELIAQSIAIVHMKAEGRTLYPFALQPIAVELQSTGADVDLQIEHEMAQDFRLYDPVTDQWSQDLLWTTQMSIAADQTETLIAYILAPNQSGSAAMTTRVSVLMGGNPNLLLELDTPLVIPADLQEMVDSTIEALRLIDNNSHCYSKAKKTLKILERLNTDTNMRLISLKKNIHHLLKAINYASRIRHEDGVAIRHKLDRLLETYTSAYYHRDN